MRSSLLVPLLLVLQANAFTDDQSPTVTFKSPGPKRVTLRVCDAAGRCSTKTLTVNVLSPAPRIASISLRSFVGSSSHALPVTAQVTGKPPFTTTSWDITTPFGRSAAVGNPIAWGPPAALGRYSFRFTLRNAHGLATRTASTTVVPSTFRDADASSPFFASLETAHANRIILGAPGLSGYAPALRPAEPISRGDAALFAARAHFSVPVPSTSNSLSDVAALSAEHIHATNRLAQRGVPLCGPTSFCPSALLLRSALPPLLLRTLHGPGFNPPPATGRFADAPAGSAEAAWLEEAARRNLLASCSPLPNLRICPFRPVTREELLHAVVVAWKLQQQPKPLAATVPLCCTYPAGIQLPVASTVSGGIPDAYQIDANGDGRFELSFSDPGKIVLNLFAVGTVRPALRLRRGTYLSPSVTLPALTVTRRSFPSPSPPTGIKVEQLDVVHPTATDPPGTFPRSRWRVAWTAPQTVQGVLVYARINRGSQFLAGLLAPDRTAAKDHLLLPVLGAGDSVALFFRSYSSAGIGFASPTLTVTVR